MEDAAAAQAAAFDAVAETPVIAPVPKKVYKMFHFDQPKKDMILALIAVIIILICLTYIPYQISNLFKIFLYTATLIPASMGLGYTVTKYQEMKTKSTST
jgi:hypothetical protein